MIASATLFCAMFATTTAAPVPKERAEAEKVVGVWKLVKSSNMPDGLNVELTMELAQGGKLTLRQTSNGKQLVYEGEYKLMKGEIPYTVKYGPDREKKETLTIKKLTETELHVVDPDGIQEDFERVKPEEKKEKPEEK